MVFFFNKINISCRMSPCRQLFWGVSKVVIIIIYNDNELEVVSLGINFNKRILCSIRSLFYHRQNKLIFDIILVVRSDKNIHDRSYIVSKTYTKN